MKKCNLYIDFDGVILDTITPLYEEIKMHNISKEDLFDFFRNYPWEDIISDEYIINDSISDIDSVISCDKFNVFVLTHINSLDEGVLKVNYLHKYFPRLNIILCPRQMSKSSMVFPKNSILVDDYSKNLSDWEDNGGIAIRFNLDGDTKEFKTISSLKELIDMF